MTAPGMVMAAMSYSEVVGSSAVSSTVPRRNVSRRRMTNASSIATPLGETCLSSPTTSSFLPRITTGRAVMSDWLASSMMTRSKVPSSLGSCSATRHSGRIQHGTAAAASSAASRIARRRRLADLPVPAPSSRTARLKRASADAIPAVMPRFSPRNVVTRTMSPMTARCSRSSAAWRTDRSATVPRHEMRRT